jgi:hypothetical protein
VVTDKTAEEDRLLDLDELGLQEVLLVQPVDVGVGQGPAGGLARVEGEQVPRHEVEVADVDDAAGGLPRADGQVDLGHAGLVDALFLDLHAAGKLAAFLNEIELPFREPAHLDLAEDTEVAVIVEAGFGGNRAGFGWPDVEPGERLVQLAPQGADQPADAEK